MVAMPACKLRHALCQEMTTLYGGPGQWLVRVGTRVEQQAQLTLLYGRV